MVQNITAQLQESFETKFEAFKENDKFAYIFWQILSHHRDLEASKMLSVHKWGKSGGRKSVVTYRARQI